jgi:transcriptional regulator with XRE-family HTH domain
MQEKPLDNYLRGERRATRITQDEIAFLLGLKDGSTVSRYESGPRLPDLRVAFAYEAILGISVRELFEGVFREVELGVQARAKILAERLGEKTPAIVLAVSKEKTCGEQERGS